MKLYYLLFLLLVIPTVTAQSGHITLLTVSETESGNEVGGLADLYLDIKPGSGRIFIDSFPLTRLDTQISARFAKEVACDFVDQPCDNKDFFYTIRSGSTIVGGPSAGAAMTLLTISLLDDVSLPEDVVITGTINSGGIIGPVAGIPEKIGAAAESGKSKVLIPKLDPLSLNTSNSTENISYEDAFGIPVIKVGNVEDALYEFTGKSYAKDLPEVVSTEEYDALMQQVAGHLCQRFIETRTDPLFGEVNVTEADELFNFSEHAQSETAFYSQASYCFGANLHLTRVQLEEKNPEELQGIYRKTYAKLNDFEEKLDQVEVASLSDLETFMIVRERILDAKTSLMDINQSNISTNQLAYAVERYYSAVSWSQFFALETEPFILEREKLESSCFDKLAEAEERINYVSLYLPEAEQRLNEELQQAHRDARQGDFELCLFKASTVKSDANVLLSSLFVGTSQVDTLLNEKFIAAEKVLAEQQMNNLFPILGYSYYQYADSLRDADPYSALLYLEYALELSKLDMYFPPSSARKIPSVPVKELVLFGMGIVTGLLIAVLILKLKRKTQKDSKKTRNPSGKKR